MLISTCLSKRTNVRNVSEELSWTANTQAVVKMSLQMSDLRGGPAGEAVGGFLPHHHWEGSHILHYIMACKLCSGGQESSAEGNIHKQRKSAAALRPVWTTSSAPGASAESGTSWKTPPTLPVRCSPSCPPEGFSEAWNAKQKDSQTPTVLGQWELWSPSPHKLFQYCFPLQ